MSKRDGLRRGNGNGKGRHRKERGERDDGRRIRTLPKRHPKYGLRSVAFGGTPDTITPKGELVDVG